jgi:hypothetical protein
MQDYQGLIISTLVPYYNMLQEKQVPAEKVEELD